MTPSRYYFETFLIPNYQDFLENELSIRHAMNASGSAYNIAEWLVNQYAETPEKLLNLCIDQFGGKKNALLKEYRKLLNARFIPSGKSQSRDDYFLLGNIWDGYKHLKLDRRDAKVEDGMSVSRGGMRWKDSFFWSEFQGSIEHLVIDQNDGQRRNFNKVIKTVVDGWFSLFEQYDL